MIFAACAWFCTHCGDAGQDRVALPLWLAGSSLSAAVETDAGFAVELQSAQLAFGPLYLCPGFQAGGFCSAARVEWLDSRVVNLLDDEAQTAGSLSGVSGRVRSYMYDLGITSLLTLQQPLLLEATEDLDGNSLVLEGVARQGERDLPFRVAMAVQQDTAVGRGVPVVLKTLVESFDHEISVRDVALTLRFDPSGLLRDVDFPSLQQDEVCSAGGEPVVCAGNVEQQCDAGGVAVSQVDCTTTGEVCARGIGCSERVEFIPGSQAYRAVRNALISGARPSFEWTTRP